MITSCKKHIKLSVTVISLLASSLMLSACGGGSAASIVLAGIGGTGIVFGPVTGFGSVFVNGRRFDTNAANFIVDGNAGASQADLKLGMVLKLKVETEDGLYTGDAITVEYDDDIQGPISGPITTSADGTQKTFSIFGQTITIDDTGTLFEGKSFATIAVNDVVEISGFRVSPVAIEATYVEFKETLDLTNSEVEIRGEIGSYSGGPPETFVVDGVTVTVDAMTEIDVPNGILQNGLSVEVEGIIQTATTMLATRVEFETNELTGDVDDVSLQGIVSNYGSLANFEIAGLVIDASSAQLSPANAAALLANGVEVEVEGDIIGGVLIAEELEIEEGETELKARVSSVTPASNTLEVFYNGLPGMIVVRVDEQTTFKDETGGSPVPNMTINDLVINDYVKIEGQEVAGEVVAKVVKRDDPEAFKLKGAVDAFDFLNWIEILGIRYNVDGDTDYEDANGDPVPDAADFFNTLNVGDILEIEDEQPGDGTAEEVAFED